MRSKRKTYYIYHVYATYQPRGSNTIHQFDGVTESNGRVDRQKHLDSIRKGVSSYMADMVGYTPPSDNVVIQSLTFLHEVKR